MSSEQNIPVKQERFSKKNRKVLLAGEVRRTWSYELWDICLVDYFKNSYLNSVGTISELKYDLVRIFNPCIAVCNSL